MKLKEGLAFWSVVKKIAERYRRDDVVWLYEKTGNSEKKRYAVLKDWKPFGKPVVDSKDLEVIQRIAFCTLQFSRRREFNPSAGRTPRVRSA